MTPSGTEPAGRPSLGVWTEDGGSDVTMAARGGGERESTAVAPAADRATGFEQLYSTEYEPMLRIAFLLVDSNEAAEEAVHDAYARVYERWSRLGNPGGYLRTCVV